MSRSWAAFLSKFDWKWFVTLTFRHPLSAARAHLCFTAFIAEMENASNSPLFWFAVEERGATGRVHIHLLVLGVDPRLKRKWEATWFSCAGTAQIREYVPDGGAAKY